MAAPHQAPQDFPALRRKLLGWYVRHRRDLPWRRTRDSYAIWVSEIMLQQTRVAAVVERYDAFLARFPAIADLARAGEQEVLAAWSGLGYYRRARMLHQTARLLAKQNQSELPATTRQLRTLPGIGVYTAAAIASIAHGQCAAVVDGNVERVLCRLRGWSETGGRAAGLLRRRIERLAARLIDSAHPGDWNQAVMELGATVCLPRNPRCLVCPIAGWCKTRGEHKTRPRAPMMRREIAHALVVRSVKAESAGAAPVHKLPVEKLPSEKMPVNEMPMQEILLEQRPADASVMPGMWELPLLRNSAAAEPELCITIRHTIMQVNYVAKIRKVTASGAARLTVKTGRRRWVRCDRAANMALTGLTRKALKAFSEHR